MRGPLGCHGKGPDATQLALACVCPLPVFEIEFMSPCPALPCHEAMAHIAALTGCGFPPGCMDVQGKIVLGSWATAPPLIIRSPPLSRAATALHKSLLLKQTPAECSVMVLGCVGVSDARAKWLPCGEQPDATPLALACVCPLPNYMASCPALPATRTRQWQTLLH